MSLPTPIPVTCPACQQMQVFTAWRSLNVTIDPNRKSEVISGELTRFTCSKCGNVAEIFYPMLYHDMDRQFMVWMLPRDPAAATTMADEPEDLPPETFAGLGADYRFRKVATHIEMVEKILVLDRGLDDRVVELVKLILWEQLPPEQRPAGMSLLFTDLLTGEDGREDGPRFAFTLLGPDGTSGVSVPRDPLYSGCERSFVAGRPQPSGWPTVDRDFAAALVEEVGPPDAGDPVTPSGGVSSDASPPNRPIAGAVPPPKGKKWPFRE